MGQPNQAAMLELRDFHPALSFPAPSDAKFDYILAIAAARTGKGRTLSGCAPRILTDALRLAKQRRHALC
jgi:hypothetical protein